MRQIQCMIVDDDPVARATLKHYCSKVNFLNVIGVAENGLEAFELLQQTKVDLLFLDVEMPELSGMELLHSLQDPPQVIVQSSEEKYAFEAFQLEVSDYLSKPFNFPRFMKAVEKVRKGIDSENTSRTGKAETIYVNINSRLVKIDVGDIKIMEANGDYVRISTHDKTWTVHTTLKKLEDRLPDDKFLRVHRSWIVNLDHIVDIEDSSILVGKDLIPVSRNNKEALFQALNIL